MKTNRRSFFAMLAGAPVAAAIAPPLSLNLNGIRADIQCITKAQISAGTITSGVITADHIKCADIHQFIDALKRGSAEMSRFNAQVKVQIDAGKLQVL
jgi:hypothetical protein